jgi:hypothetical protein
VPRIRRDFVRLESRMGRASPRFGSLTRFASSDVSSYLSEHGGPPVRPLDEFDSLGSSSMASENRVVMGCDDSFS